MTKRTVALIVLDGWGIGDRSESNPLHVANLPRLRDAEERYPFAALQASGIGVGLSWGEVGNSEVGHLTIGAGRVIYQYFPRISMAVKDGTFFKNKALQNVMRHAKESGRAVHLVGLLTEGMVHASLEHLIALIQMAENEQVPVKLHLFADGMDSGPKTFEKLLARIPHNMIAGVIGRVYAMNHDENWSLTQKAYEWLTQKNVSPVASLDPIIKMTYERNGTEEFLPPVRLEPDAEIKEGDSLIFFNFREDGMRQLTRAFADPAFKEFPRELIPGLTIATMTNYSPVIRAAVAFPPEVVQQPMGTVLSDAGKNQLRIAETLKYAHVTYFFNAYQEAPSPNEYRVLIPSAHVPHIEDHPEMMAGAISDRVVEALLSGGFDFILANYANGDAVAHTGNFPACVKAAEVIDHEMGRLMDAAAAGGAILIITADHGNIESVVDPKTGAPETLHNLNPVPFYLIGKDFEGKKFEEGGGSSGETIGILSDVAPTILALMGINAPPEMTGESLLRYIR